MIPVLRSLTVVVMLATWLLPGCAGMPASSVSASTESAPAVDTLKLQRVVMLMRHGVRPPTKAQVVPAGMNDKPWPKWSVDYGQLTPRGYDAVKLLGHWDRSHWAARGLLPMNGCPPAVDIEIAASSKPRTQDTARALLEGMAPECGLEVDFPATPDDDVEFHPLEAGAMPIDADEALRAVQALSPPGGMQAERVAHARGLALLDQALGCTGTRAQSGCSLAAMPAAIVRNENDRPDVGDPFGIASTVSQTFLLEYLEGMPMSDVAWGRLSRQQIEELLEFHSLKFYYEGRAPYVAARAASPLASRMLEAMLDGPKLTVLAGHDTNIADLGGFLDLHWKVPSYPRDDPPPGGALGFEVLADAQGNRFVRAFYRSQTMDQVRELQPLSAANAPAYEYLPIPGCASLCPLSEFEGMVRAKLVEPMRRKPGA
ncbi:histidine-type phosphatase [Pseudoxanthomonas yeongjuensis]|uniref:histidine-type phosphatase n=1 Tax=Pseudoxanthomonas yeongjuensis TaxID=377616 RepID=UPI0013907FE2|nr:histidine-type phosphatase [Pseudoxanthomonas yeongjuensis]KAF1718405.1 histidine-type phosphatase [Pseudoxanthomonas yeongjuensis]